MKDGNLIIHVFKKDHALIIKLKERTRSDNLTERLCSYLVDTFEWG